MTRSRSSTRWTNATSASRNCSSIPTGGSATARRFPAFDDLMGAFERLVASHPRTTFIGAHVAGAAEDLAWVGGCSTPTPTCTSTSRRASRSWVGNRAPARPAGTTPHPHTVRNRRVPADQEVYAIHFRFLETADESLRVLDRGSAAAGPVGDLGPRPAGGHTAGGLPRQRTAVDPRAGPVVISGRQQIRPDAAVRGLFVPSGFVIAAFFPFLALYLDGKGLSESEIGLVIAAMAVARIVLNPFWGHVSDSRARPADLVADRIGARRPAPRCSCERARPVGDRDGGVPRWPGPW